MTSYRRSWTMIWVTVLAILGGLTITGQAEPVKGKLHQPAEMMKLIEASKLEYKVVRLKEKISPEIPGPVLGSELWLKNEGGRQSLKRYVVPSAVTSYLKNAERAFHNQQYDEAVRLYGEVAKLWPDFAHVHVLIGDAYYKKGEYRQAKASFERAIQMNFIDYEAHWFLADTLWRMGERTRALEEITLGHLLNVNHQEMKNVLRGYRGELGQPWKDWEFVPQYRISAKGNEITVETNPDWVGYALVKAYWKYEPGYAEKMVGPEYHKQLICSTEEKEALLALLTRPGLFANLEKIIKDGFLKEMLLYEIVARRAPSAIIMLPPKDLSKIVTYCGRYH